MIDDTESTPPIVSIGLFVYNGEKTIGAVIESLLGQTYSDFELIISDNASSDKTEEICLSYAGKDARIRYLRQKENIGPNRNIEFVFQQSKGEFFMWAADDDLRAPDFIEEALKTLQLNPECSFSSSPNCFEGEEGRPDKLKTFSLHGTLYERFSTFVGNSLVSHGCFYSLFRRKLLEDFNGLSSAYLASDWVIILHLLSKGNFTRSGGGLLVLGYGASTDPDFISRFRTSPVHYVLPFYEFSRRFIKLVANSDEFNWLEKSRLLLKLIRFNCSLPLASGRAALGRVFRAIVRK